MTSFREGGPVTVKCPHCGKEYEVESGTNPAGWVCPHCGARYEEGDA